MTEQEAINYFNNSAIDTGVSVENMVKTSELINISIEALEKQIPKEPRFYNCDYYCPVCDDLVGRHDTIMKRDNKFCKYCGHCGQAIKWE